MAAIYYKISDIIRECQMPVEETKLLLRHILNLTPAQLILNYDTCLSHDQLEQFNSFSTMRQNKMPLNYILGYREFYSRCFKVNQNTLIPRPETEQIVDIMLMLAQSKDGKLKALDLGTGSGVIAITAKLEYPQFNMFAVDKFALTLEVAQENANNLDAEVNFQLSDWFSEVKGMYDIIVSNPPYIAANDAHLIDLCYEPRTALTDFETGFTHLSHIINYAPSYLKEDGWLIVEHGFNQGDTIHAMYVNAGFKNVQTLQDYSGLDRVTMGQKNG